MQQIKNKLIAMAVLLGVLVLGLSLIGDLVQERQDLAVQVQHDIARSSSGSQKIIGPILIATFEDLELGLVSAPKKLKADQPINSRVYYHKALLPETYDFKTHLETEYRQLGIYKALLYLAKGNISGRFKLPTHWWTDTRYKLTDVKLVVAISDVRGIKNGFSATINNEKFELLPGTGVEKLGAGAHITMTPQWLKQQKNIDFTLTLNLQGMEDLRITPVGKQSEIAISANWPHPNFVGNFLPHKPVIDDNGFTAMWQTTFFSTNLSDIINSCIERGKCEALNNTTLGVSLVDPVDQYLKTERAIKYAELFILLTLFSFLLFEIFKRLSIHPIQYAFVGIAMAVFYLLLLSLSEHIEFNTAYLISSVSCAAVLGIYISGVVGQIKHGLIFSGGILMLYLILFGLLAAEDFALLMGAMFIFSVLATVMIMTRKINWYQLDED